MSNQSYCHFDQRSAAMSGAAKRNSPYLESVRLDPAHQGICDQILAVYSRYRTSEPAAAYSQSMSRPSKPGDGQDEKSSSSSLLAKLTILLHELNHVVGKGLAFCGRSGNLAIKWLRCGTIV